MPEFNFNQERFLQGIEVGRRLKALRLSQTDNTENTENNALVSDEGASATETEE